MSSSGPNSPAVFVNQTAGSYTTAWSNIGNVATTDGAYASVSTTTSTDTQYLIAKGFNFTFPASATINGITVEIKRRQNSTGVQSHPDVSDNVVSLVKGGVLVGGNFASTTGWSSTAAYATYGGSSNLWGTTWTGPEVKAGSFGVALSAHVFGGSGFQNQVSAEVDHIRVTVTYTYAGNTKSVSSTVSVIAKPTRGVGKNFSTALSTAATLLRGNISRFPNVVSVTNHVTKGLTLSLKNRVSATSVLHNVSASAARLVPRSIRMWVWVQEKLEEDDWIS